MNEDFIKLAKDFLGEDVEIKYIEKDGISFYQVGDLNIEKAAELLIELM